MTRFRQIAAKLRKAFSEDNLRRGVSWAQKNVPPGLRSVLGIVLIVGGVFGFLPILGFWMIPLGGAFIALDIPPLRRRLMAWLVRDQGHTEKD
jgi:hypothetical protein